MKLAVTSSLMAALLCFSARAALYTYTPPGSGPIPQGGTVFSAEFTIPTTIESVITSIELTLIFNDNASLIGNSIGIQGLLNLGTDVGSPSVGFFPVVTSTGSGGNRIYDVVFSDFNSLDPNNTWGLVLWDNGSTGIENGLINWTLEISTVPEPTTVALICFGGLAALMRLVSWRRNLSWMTASA